LQFFFEGSISKLPVVFAKEKPARALIGLSLPHRKRFYEFFTVPIRNKNTKRSYERAAKDFFLFIDRIGITSLDDIEPGHVSAWVEHLERGHSAPTVKARLAAVRHLFDWLTTGHVVFSNPAHSVRGPKHSVKRGKTSVLSAEETRQLLDSIDTDTLIGLRDRALIATMVFSFARIGAVTSLRVPDLFTQGGRLWLRLHEKGGKRHEIPCHHTLEKYLIAYLEAAELWDTPKAFVFQTFLRTGKRSRKTGIGLSLSGRPLPQATAWQMLQRRAVAVGLKTAVCNHTFRATGITTYLKNNGTLERAATMANHSSTRTTQLYDRRTDDVTLDEVEKIQI
jgi:site-specific recombinase XerD